MAGIITQILSTILGMGITIAFVLVQITASKYIPQIIDMFLRWRINFFPLALFIFSLISVNMNASPTQDLILLFACVISLVPYFYLLFEFLKPVNLIERMSDETLVALKKKDRGKTIDGIAKINKMAKSAVQMMISEVPLKSIELEREIIIQYLDIKKNFPSEWFLVDESVFPGTPPEAMEEINRNKVWLEMQIFHQFTVIFTLILSSWYKLRDVITGILITTRIIGERACEKGDIYVLNLTIKFFNTFIRLALNSNDRTVIYNIFYQYRLLAEFLLTKNEEMSVRIASYLRYYGRLAEDLGLNYVLETSLYDIMVLNQKAVEKNAGNIETLLNDFLCMYDQARKNGNKKLLFNLQKRYLMLGGFYLLKGRDGLAEKIKECLAGTNIEEITETLQEIFEVRDPDFWEITDRIINFDYVDESHKDKIKEFVERLKKTGSC